MLNFISNKKALALGVVMLSSVALNSYATPACTSTNQINCCGNGIVEAGEACDMGASGSPATAANSFNKADADIISGCAADCSKIATAPAGTTWNCSTTSQQYLDKTNRLKALFLKLAFWQKGRVVTATATNTPIPATSNSVTNSPNVDDCIYYAKTSPNAPIIRPTWIPSTGNTVGATEGYNCPQYQKDMMEFVTLNYNTKTSDTTLDCATARTVMGITAPATLEFANPLPTDALPTSKLNTSNYNYKVNGC